MVVRRIPVCQIRKHGDRHIIERLSNESHDEATRTMRLFGPTQPMCRAERVLTGLCVRRTVAFKFKCPGIMHHAHAALDFTRTLHRHSHGTLLSSRKVAAASRTSSFAIVVSIDVMPHCAHKRSHAYAFARTHAELKFA